MGMGVAMGVMVMTMSRPMVAVAVVMVGVIRMVMAMMVKTIAFRLTDGFVAVQVRLSHPSPPDRAHPSEGYRAMPAIATGDEHGASSAAAIR